MRRALQGRLLSVDHRAGQITKVDVERVGGFAKKSFLLRYHLTLRGRDRAKQKMVLRGSYEAQDQTRRQAYEIMKYLWRHGFDRGPSQIARPVTFYYHWKLLVYQEAAGQPLGQVLRLQPRQAKLLLNRTAAWLSRLHQQRPSRLYSAYDSSGRKQYWQAALESLKTIPRASAVGLGQMVRQVMREEDRLAHSPHRVLVHHDFHPDNVLVSSTAIRVVDFTESRLSDRLVDVATMVHQLEFQLSNHFQPKTIGAWQDYFMTAYQRHSGVSVKNKHAQRLMDFIRFRVALQSLVGSAVFGQPSSMMARIVLRSPWYGKHL